MGRGMVNPVSRLTSAYILSKYQVVKEAIQGVDFTTIIEPEEVGLDSKYVEHCSPSGSKSLVRLLQDLRINGQDTILDIGCGKGSAMLAMLKFPFARVDGIELSKEISEIAIRNFTNLKKKRWQVFNGDAATFRDYSTYSMLYLYNPFPKEIMRPVIDNIQSSIAGREQEVLIIYNNAACHETLVRDGVFRKILEYKNDWGKDIFIYSNRDVQQSRLLSWLGAPTP